MKISNRKRRSERIAARHNIMLVVDDPGNSGTKKEVVTTLHISRHGAHVRGRQPLAPNSTGSIMNLSSCRKAPFRVAWHELSASQPGFRETGIELIETDDFWGQDFAALQDATPVGEATQSAIPPAMPTETTGVGLEGFVDVRALVDHLRIAGDSPRGRERLEALWCGLVEQLEEKRIFSRSELIGALRKVGLQS